MKAVLKCEFAQGRRPLDISGLGVGYDIKSEGPSNEVRYIEVKGHGTTGDVILYYTEWRMAHRMREEFYIYEVYYATSRPDIWITQDPVGKGLEPTERVVECQLSTSQLRGAAGRDSAAAGAE